MFTVDDAKKWVAENFDNLTKERLECEDKAVQLFNRTMPALSENLWNSGCWLGAQLRIAGCSEDRIAEIQMAQGQRSFAGDPYESAVDYVNEFVETGNVEETGGTLLAEKLLNELTEEAQDLNMGY